MSKQSLELLKKENTVRLTLMAVDRLEPLRQDADISLKCIAAENYKTLGIAKHHLADFMHSLIAEVPEGEKIGKYTQLITLRNEVIESIKTLRNA